MVQKELTKPTAKTIIGRLLLRLSVTSSRPQQGQLSVIYRRFALPMAVRCETADFNGLDVESGHCACGESSES
jgi:hypothetical protein